MDMELMYILRNSIFILIFCGLLYGNLGNKYTMQQPCHLAEENKDYDLILQWKFQSDFKNKTLIVQTFDKVISKCFPPENCTDYVNKIKTILTINDTSLELNVVIKFNNMSRKHDGNWYLYSDDVASELNFTLNVFARATAECKHTIFEEKVLIFCSTKKCYPEPKCETTLVFKNMTAVAHTQPMNQSSEKLSSNPVSYQANCSTFLPIHNVTPGEYLILIRLYQNIAGCGNDSTISTNYTLPLTFSNFRPKLEDESECLKDDDALSCECEEYDTSSLLYPLLLETINSGTTFIIRNGSQVMKMFLIDSTKQVKRVKANYINRNESTIEEKCLLTWQYDENFLEKSAHFLFNQSKCLCQNEISNKTKNMSDGNDTYTVSYILNITRANTTLRYNEILVLKYPNVTCDNKEKKLITNHLSDFNKEKRAGDDSKRNIPQSAGSAICLLFMIYFTFTIYAYINNCFSDGRNKIGNDEVEIDNMYIYNVEARPIHSLYSTIDSMSSAGDRETQSTLKSNKGLVSMTAYTQ